MGPFQPVSICNYSSVELILKISVCYLILNKFYAMIMKILNILETLIFFLLFRDLLLKTSFIGSLWNPFSLIATIMTPIQSTKPTILSFVVKIPTEISTIFYSCCSERKHKRIFFLFFLFFDEVFDTHCENMRTWGGFASVFMGWQQDGIHEFYCKRRFLRIF